MLNSIEQNVKQISHTVPSPDIGNVDKRVRRPQECIYRARREPCAVKVAHTVPREERG